MTLISLAERLRHIAQKHATVVADYHTLCLKDIRLVEGREPDDALGFRDDVVQAEAARRAELALPQELSRRDGVEREVDHLLVRGECGRHLSGGLRRRRCRRLKCWLATKGQPVRTRAAMRRISLHRAGERSTRPLAGVGADLVPLAIVQGHWGDA